MHGVKEMPQDRKQKDAGQPAGSTKPESMIEQVVVNLTKQEKRKAEALGSGDAQVKGLRLHLQIL